MKKLLLVILTVITSGILSTHAGYVKGYRRKDGTYVSGYYRRSPSKKSSYSSSYSPKYRGSSSNSSSYSSTYSESSYDYAPESADTRITKSRFSGPQLKVKSFLGVKIGALENEVTGKAIKGRANEKEVTIKPFRKFTKGVVTFSEDGRRVCKISSEFKMRAGASKEDAVKEAEEIVKQLEAQSGVKLKKVLYNGWLDREYVYFDPLFATLSVVIRVENVASKGMKGPYIPKTVTVYKIGISYTVTNTLDEDWYELCEEGIALP